MSVSPDTLSAADFIARIRAAKPGETIDLGKTEIPDPGRVTILDGIDGVTIKGGIWHGAVKVIRSPGVRLLGMRFAGTEPRGGTALKVELSNGAIISELVAQSWGTGLVLKNLDTFDVGQCLFSDMLADGVQGASVRNGILHDITIHGRRSLGKEHADGIQLRCEAGLPRTENVVVQDVDVTGDVQGVIGTGGGFGKLVIQRVRARVSRIRAVSVNGCDDLTIGAIDVGTLPGSERQARIILQNCPNVTWTGAGTQAGYRTAKALAFGQ